MSIKEQDKYERWWLGKKCRPSIYADSEFKKVTEVNLVGPPSFVYGDVWLTFEDGSECPVPHYGYKPRRTDVEIAPEEQEEAQKQQPTAKGAQFKN